MIKPATFNFLKDLAKNNNREWFQENKGRHDEARNNVLEFVGELIMELSKIDKTISADLDPKTCVMRIYRDVRFSLNKTPYKTNFGAGISQQGKNFNGPGYYLHIHPEESFVAGGCWMPEAEMLKSIRQEIDYSGNDFRDIVTAPDFKEYFGEPDQEYKLKTMPKGYSADHPDIKYLKLKSFTFTHSMDPKELTRNDAVEAVINGFERLHPFMIFLRNAIS
ncbi:DUF2461 domain-containing protein [Daejeonella lutea]|uniref:TIGR02453 family protein n=1 Tax=Daejeonella lutea TaxID=572036 RepID=A0A1T5D0L2_9SPHI|nr:DUF2461 domain-containing protein [Daejeonella lutea]SKB65146.1 TIGR02453 family protein [Daejeonella lutea]